MRRGTIESSGWVGLMGELKDLGLKGAEYPSKNNNFFKNINLKDLNGNFS